jgi:hypothetical protein
VPVFHLRERGRSREGAAVIKIDALLHFEIHVTHHAL